MSATLPEKKNCSQCVQPGKICKLCRTRLCEHHYKKHSCMTDLDDPSEEVMAAQERRDEELRQEERT